jgi:hypothetical protein
MSEAPTIGTCIPILKGKTHSSKIIYFRSEMTRSPWMRSNCCPYWTKRSFNMRRHRQRVNGLECGQRNQRLLVNGQFVCRMHDVPIRFVRRYQLRRHLYFVHRGDNQQDLSRFSINGQIIESLCTECKRTAYEYKQARDLCKNFCDRYVTDSSVFESFLDLNHYFEKQMQEKLMIEG